MLTAGLPELTSVKDIQYLKVWHTSSYALTPSVWPFAAGSSCSTQFWKQVEDKMKAMNSFKGHKLMEVGERMTKKLLLWMKILI